MTSDPDQTADIQDLIRKLRKEVTRKPGAATRHLLKRKLRGHLPVDASLKDYDQLIGHLLENNEAAIYVYYTGEISYLAVVARFDNKVWLVIMSFEGVMETAFVVENPDAYLERDEFQFFGLMGEVIK